MYYPIMYCNTDVLPSEAKQQQKTDTKCATTISIDAKVTYKATCLVCIHHCVHPRYGLIVFALLLFLFNYFRPNILHE